MVTWPTRKASPTLCSRWWTFRSVAMAAMLITIAMFLIVIFKISEMQAVDALEQKLREAKAIRDELTFQLNKLRLERQQHLSEDVKNNKKMEKELEAEKERAQNLEEDFKKASEYIGGKLGEYFAHHSRDKIKDKVEARFHREYREDHYSDHHQEKEELRNEIKALRIQKERADALLGDWDDLKSRYAKLEARLETMYKAKVKLMEQNDELEGALAKCEVARREEAHSIRDRSRSREGFE